MSRKEKFSASEKLNAIKDYLSGNKGISQISRDMKVNQRTIYDWVDKYKVHGADGVTNAKKNKYYPETIKVKAVRDYLDEKASLREVCRQYEISSNAILRQWIKRYNGLETFKSHNIQGDKIMTRGRKTTFEERVEIVSFCIANNYNYQMSVDKFQVSYQQVYTWVKKYEERGSESLSDKRGKRKGLEELSESEKLDARLKLLEAENNRLRMENDYLKKLEEIGRRR